MLFQGHKFFFWIAASVAGAAAVNPNGTKALLANGVTTSFINGKSVVINGLRKLRNPASWLLTFLVVPFNKIPLFSKDLISFIVSFILLFATVIPETEIAEIPFLTFLPVILSPVSARRLSTFLGSIF